MSDQDRYDIDRPAQEGKWFERTRARRWYKGRLPTFYLFLTCLAGLLICIGVTGCEFLAACDSFYPAFYVEGQLLGADLCPLKNAIVQLEWGTAKDAERNYPTSPREVSTDDTGVFHATLSSYVPFQIRRSTIDCLSEFDWYEPADLEMIKLTIDAEDAVETIEVTIAEEMIIGSNSFSEIDIDLGVIMLQEISTCGEDATGDES